MTTKCKWLFLEDNKGMLFTDRQLGKQMQVWLFLNPESFLESLGLRLLKENIEAKTKGYIS